LPTTKEFYSIYAHGFLRVAVCTPPVHLGAPHENAAEVIALSRQASAEGAAVTLFPELGLSAYTNDELFFQRPVLAAVHEALAEIARATLDLRSLVVVGAPLEVDGRLYNAAIALHRGRILGVVPKSYLPNYREFYEKRYFAPGAGVRGVTIDLAGQRVPFGVDIIFNCANVPAFKVGIEICEDLWTPLPPSSLAALAGATVLLNLSASNITVGKAEVRRQLCKAQAMQTVAAYLYAAAGPGESTTDLAWDGHAIICDENGLLAESQRFGKGEKILFADIDVERLATERMKLNTWGDAAETHRALIERYRRVDFVLDAPTGDIGFRRTVERFPFVPSDAVRLDEDCYEAYNIQVQGLVTRLAATRVKKVVIGISGGLDSTQALIVCAKAIDRLGLPRTNILAYTMPGFGTSAGTRSNAWALMEAFGATPAEISINDVSMQTLKDIGHPAGEGASQFDITYENVQAGARTATLFRLANLHNGIVIGTGDLSELALGWCTYGVGDHMSHYGVNAGVPKTMIQYLIRWAVARDLFGPAASAVLQSVLDTEISPELVPATPGQSVQRTEDTIGPYELQDFNIYWTVRHGFAPSKVAFLAWHAWRDAASGRWPESMPEARRHAYSLADIRKWLEVFLFRFFTTSQFKRSAVPNSPKVLSGASLSPRGDWRAPSDGNAKLWLEELKANVPDG